MTQPPRIVVYGASGMSVASAYNLARGGARPVCEVAAYIDDFRGGAGETLNGAPILSFEEWRRDWSALACYVAIGDPKARRALSEKIEAAGGFFTRFYDAPDLVIPGVDIGAGSAVGMPTCFNPPNTSVGRHVQIMPMCSIGHDVVIGDYVTLCPSCTVSGYVVIEPETFVGAGVTIVNGTAARPLVIGRGAKLMAGAVVTKSVGAGAAVAGNPARSLRDLARARREARA